MTEEGGGGGKLDEGVEVAAGLGLAWAFEFLTEIPSLNRKQIRTTSGFLIWFLR